jgi:hypothetical protein
MEFTYIQDWLDVDSLYDVFEKIDIIITPLDDGTWRASIFSWGDQLHDSTGAVAMCAEAATLNEAMAALDILCMNDLNQMVDLVSRVS